MDSRHIIGCYPTAIIWDLDGTLIDSAPDLAQALSTLLGEHGHRSLGEDPVRSMIGNGIEKLIERGFEAVGVTMRELDLQNLLPRFMSIYAACATDKTRLYPSVKSVLQHFADIGVRQGICTNKSEQISRQILSDLSIAQYFGIVVGGDTTPVNKPDPLPLRKCIEGLYSTPDFSIMIGDSGVDVAIARAVNIPVGIVAHGYAGGAIEGLGADFVIDDLSSLPRLIGALHRTG